MSSAAKSYEGDKIKDNELWRDLTAYWFLGLCNNFGYVVMLSAAHDIIGHFEALEHGRSERSAGEKRDCHEMSTGAILLADILPMLIAKMICPFVPFAVNIRIALAVGLTVASFIFVAFATKMWMAFFGVILTSASSGLGESTLVSYTYVFNKNCISTWSSGTGGAGIFGAISYASLRAIGLSTRDTLLVMLIVPVMQAFCFWVLLRNPEDVPDSSLTTFDDDEMVEDAEDATVKEQVIYIWNLMHYIVPLFLVYFFEYLINQGLFELVYYKSFYLNHPSQYRWFQVTYQVGVFTSRSSVNIVQIRKIWVLAILQGLNVVYFMSDAIWFYTPSFWISVCAVYWEGLLGGAGYVNTFYRMSKEITPMKRRFAISIVVMSDSCGVLLAALSAMPVHNAICKMPVYN